MFFSWSLCLHLLSTQQVEQLKLPGTAWTWGSQSKGLCQLLHFWALPKRVVETRDFPLPSRQCSYLGCPCVDLESQGVSDFLDRAASCASFCPAPACSGHSGAALPETRCPQLRPFTPATGPACKGLCLPGPPGSGLALPSSPEAGSRAARC